MAHKIGYYLLISTKESFLCLVVLSSARGLVHDFKELYLEGNNAIYSFLCVYYGRIFYSEFLYHLSSVLLLWIS